jgi:hypothetical protein
VWVIHFHFPHLLFLFPKYCTCVLVQALSLFCYAFVWISIASHFVIAWSYMIIIGWQFKLKCFNFHFDDLHEILSYSTD